MMAYLDNMNNVIQDQRDVMLSYFGQDGLAPRAAKAARQFNLASDAQDIVEATPVEEEEQEDVGDELPNILTMSHEAVMDLILKVVSEKTGYPIDMLDFEANLEADLSIDSIKKMEIVGGLREHALFPANFEDMEDSFEKLISIKTLQELLDWIVGLKDTVDEGAEDAQGEFKGVQAVADAQPADDEVDSTFINRIVPDYAEAPEMKVDADFIKGARFAVTDDGEGVAKAVAALLEERGASVTVVSADAGDLTDCDGIVLLNIAASKNHYTTIDFLKLIKQADIEKLRWIFSFDDAFGTVLERGLDLEGLALLEGFTGLIKVLKHEYGDKSLCSVGFHTPIDPATLPAIVADELCNTEPFPEIFYRGAERLSTMLAFADFTDADEGTASHLNENSHVLVLGGAQGITPPLLTRLAKIYPCHYILLGRSDDTLEKEEYRELSSLDEIRTYLIETEGMKQPAEIEKKIKQILKTNQIRHAVESIEAAGARASYYSVDVRDTEAFRALVSKLRETYGSFDGVIHAAGILEDKLFRDKQVDSFGRVYGTKVDPLQVIIGDLLDDLKLLIMFSSVASTFGNPGQCDYAAGNSVMDSVAQILSRQRPELRVIAFNWGPWKGAGMVNEGIEQAFRKKGIGFLHLDEGGTFFVNEIMRGDRHNVIAMSGDKQKLEEMIRTALSLESVE
jgi:NAD(P)-dependent dehydrogenase (short-subunit alcohol dehydrogenase family)/acyl carrier protein